MHDASREKSTHLQEVYSANCREKLSEKGYEQRSNRDWPPYGVRNEPKSPSLTNVIAPPPGELFSETNDNSVVILLTYGTACVLLAGDAEAKKEEYMAKAST
jgi:beta-lactamase superfamily II metal-dependent hydrolase